jgi:acetyl-CoA C-acetyltransferase
MGTPNVWILGGYQSDFARNFAREGHDFAVLTGEVVDNTLAAAKVDATEIEVVHVANAFGEMFARQGHLGAMPASVNDGLWDTPASRHEAACASGSVATLSALADLRSGAYHIALVVGVELEKTVPGDTAAQHLGAAAWTDHEGTEAKFMWPYMFDRVAAKQVSGTAGDYQVESAKTFGTLNFGGSTATTVSFIVSGV